MALRAVANSRPRGEAIGPEARARGRQLVRFLDQVVDIRGPDETVQVRVQGWLVRGEFRGEPRRGPRGRRGRGAIAGRGFQASGRDRGGAGDQVRTGSWLARGWPRGPRSSARPRSQPAGADSEEMGSGNMSGS